MTDPKLFYKRSGNKEPVSLDDLEEITLKYVRNLRLGFPGHDLVTIDVLKRWFEFDRDLTEFPPDVILQRWLDKWTPTYLARWSYKNDHVNQTRTN